MKAKGSGGGDSTRLHQLEQRCRVLEAEVRGLRESSGVRLRQSLQEALAGIASEMILLPSTEFDAVVHDALSTLGKLANAARVAVWIVAGEGKVGLAHEWRADPTSEARQRELPVEAFAQYATMLARHQVVEIRRPEDIPVEAVNERAWIATHGFEALLFVPLFSRGALHGTLGFYGETGQERDWPNELVSLLEIAGAILVAGYERRNAESALRDNERRLARIVETSPVGICIVDRQGAITFANSMAERILGLSREQLGDRAYNAPDWVHRTLDGGPFDRDQLPVAQVLRTGQPVVGVEHTIEPHGQRVAISVNATPLHDDAGVMQGVVAAFVDITERVRQQGERQRLDLQIQHAQKLESLGVLAGGIAHDFNNLLVAIVGNIDLALMSLPPESAVRANLHDAESAAQRAADLTRQMLAYSGRGRFVVEPLHLGNVVEEMAHILKVSVSKKAVLRWNLAPNLPLIEADSAQMRQVIMNLVVNASEALGDGSGVLALSTGAMECDRAYLVETWLDDALPAGTYVYFEVTDTGCGMDHATSVRVFDPFFSTKFVGRGLGLPAVLGIVRGHRGAIKIQSEAGKGSTFRVLLPAVQRPAEPQAVPVRRAEWRTSGTILLVDDEESVRTVAKQMLERLGLTVLLACDGCEAIEVFRAHLGEIRLVLLDLTMPRMNGDEAFQEMKKLQPDVKVIVSSGYHENEVQGRFAGLGLAGVIQKPFQLSMLREKLRLVL